MGRVKRSIYALQESLRHQALIADVARDVVRMTPQVAALEERLERLRVRVDQSAAHVAEGETAEALSILEEVRAEHARIRARIAAAAVFEERLRVIEERLGIQPSMPAPLPNDD